MTPREAWRRGASLVGSSLKLLGRLATDRRVDLRRRIGVGLALAYAVSPVDLLPDRIPVVGTIDDMVVAAAAVKVLLDGADDDVLAEHWDGEPEDLVTLRRALDAAAELVPRRMRWLQQALVPEGKQS